MRRGCSCALSPSCIACYKQARCGLQAAAKKQCMTLQVSAGTSACYQPESSGCCFVQQRRGWHPHRSGGRSATVIVAMPRGVGRQSLSKLLWVGATHRCGVQHLWQWWESRHRPNVPAWLVSCLLRTDLSRGISRNMASLAKHGCCLPACLSLWWCLLWSVRPH
jgi:hypothetical protein